MQHPYISGPMTGYGSHNFPAFFEADHKLRDFGYSPINPAAEAINGGARSSTWEDAYAQATSNPATWHDYIKRDIELVLASDGIVLLRGWDESKGSCLEVVTGISVGLPVFHFRENYAASCLELYRANLEVTLAEALHHLARCGTKGVDVKPNGHVKYV